MQYPAFEPRRPPTRSLHPSCMLNALKPITYKQTGALIPVIAALYSPIRVHTRIPGCSLTGMYGLLPLRHAQSISTGLCFHDASDSCCTSRCPLDPVTLPAATLSDLVSWDSRQPPSGLATLDFLSVCCSGLAVPPIILFVERGLRT